MTCLLLILSTLAYASGGEGARCTAGTLAAERARLAAQETGENPPNASLEYFRIVSRSPERSRTIQDLAVTYLERPPAARKATFAEGSALRAARDTLSPDEYAAALRRAVADDLGLPASAVQGADLRDLNAVVRFLDSYADARTLDPLTEALRACQGRRNCLARAFTGFFGAGPEQPAPAAVAARDRQTANIPGCCLPVRTGGQTPKALRIPADPRHDPYVAGWDLTLSRHPRPAEYQFTLPPELGATRLEGLPESITLTRAPESARLAEELARLNVPHSELAGRGSTSSAFFALDEAMPAEVAGGSSLQRAMWLKSQATQVIKLLGIGRETQSAASIATSLRRLLINYRYLAETADRVRFRGQPLVAPPRILSTAAEHARGVLRMEVGRGPSARQLQNAIHCLTLNNCVQITPANAQEVLRWAGLDAAEGQQYIDALVHYYRDSHTPSLLLQARNGLGHDAVSNPTRSGGLSSTGLDFLNGENVVWDPQRRVFIPIDI